MTALPGLREALDLLQPRTLCTSLLRGSWVLARLLARLLLAGLRRATSPAAPPARKGPPAKVDVRKTDGPPDAEEGESAPAGKPTTGKAAAAARAGGDRLQQAGMSLLVCLVAGAALSSVGGVLLHLLRPYMPVVTAVLVVTWFAAALTADAITHPKNDHETGEEPAEEQPDDTEEETPDGQDEDDLVDHEEEDQEEDVDPWPAQEKLLVKFVEQRVAATAGGYSENIRGRGARVIDLLTEQQENGGLIGLDQKDLIELLEKAGITVREQMKFRVLTDTPDGVKWVQKNNPGVHVVDLTKCLRRRPCLPPHLVADLTLNQPPVPALVAVPDPAPETPPIPLQRAAGE
ncbi:hypothetical protein ACKI16_29585 [Streptomyces scabiei]|uniref:hypothetical protein n=1 Tax=Streptomyces scabiei TaxID=1930 RepID=UPI0038F63A89